MSICPQCGQEIQVKVHAMASPQGGLSASQRQGLPSSERLRCDCGSAAFLLYVTGRHVDAQCIQCATWLPLSDLM